MTHYVIQNITMSYLRRSQSIVSLLIASPQTKPTNRMTKSTELGNWEMGEAEKIVKCHPMLVRTSKLC